MKIFRVALLSIVLMAAHAGWAAAEKPITVANPAGGEVYAPGLGQTVVLDQTTLAKTVRIELSRDNGTTWESLGTIDNSNKARAQRNRLDWTPSLPATDRAVIRAVSEDSTKPGQGTSHAFSIGGPNLDDSTPDGRYVLNAGDAMTGPLTLSGDPTAGLGAATKQYVDAGGATNWKLLGNSGTSATSNFLGTTDATDLVIRTNNTEKIRVASSGQVGIGGAPTSSTLTVIGNTQTGALTTETATVNTLNVIDHCIITNTLGGALLDVTTTVGGRPGTFKVVNGGGQPALSVVSDSNSVEALQVTETGSAPALKATTTGTGQAGEIRINNAANSGIGLLVVTNGTGTGLVAANTGSSGDIAIFQGAPATNVARIDKTGKGFFNGGTQSSGADVAESFCVVGDRKGYEPGDVLVLSTREAMKVEKGSVPYSKLVAGVYATKPGVLLTERSIEASLADTVPMGVVGIIPTKVSGENGSIRIGDRLVTSSLSGHAMKGTDESRMGGATIGKAMEEFSGSGTGVIKVLVNVK